MFIVIYLFINYNVSESTASGQNVSETMATTGEAVEFIDKLFDSVNGSRGSSVRGKLRGPIKRNSTLFGQNQRKY